jgi:uncharacterized protein
VSQIKPELKPAMKLTVCVGEDERYQHNPVYREVVLALHKSGVAGATLTKGVMSFGIQHRLHTIKNEIQMENLPIIIEAVDERAKIERAATLIAEILGDHGLVELQSTVIVSHERMNGRKS